MKTAHIIKRCEREADESVMDGTRLCLIGGLTQRLDHDNLIRFFLATVKTCKL